MRNQSFRNLSATLFPCSGVDRLDNKNNSNDIQ